MTEHQTDDQTAAPEPSDPRAPATIADAEAVLFDLDGVLTPTAEVHMRAWRRMFEAEFAARGVTEPYTDDDYFGHLDGKQRQDGVAALLASRGIELPLGTHDDPPQTESIHGLGNRKNVVFAELLAGGIVAYPGSVRLLDELQHRGVHVAVVSSSKNAEPVLRVAGLRDRFEVVVDGLVAQRDGLPSKPAPDVFLAGAARLGVPPIRCAVIEDAVSGVESAAAGGFGLVIGVDRGTGADALVAAGAHVVVRDLAELLD